MNTLPWTPRLLIAASLAILWIVVWIVFPNGAKADIVISPTQQGPVITPSDFSGFNPGNMWASQPIGTGLSGTITGASFTAVIHSLSGGAYLNVAGITVFEFSTFAAYDDFLNGVALSSTNQYSSSFFSGVDSTPGPKTFTWNGTAGTLDDLTFNPLNYYVVNLFMIDGGFPTQGTYSFNGRPQTYFGYSCADVGSVGGTPVGTYFVSCGSSLNSLSFSLLGVGNFTPPDPPTTEFAEVIDYIPSLAVNTAVGTTTVGAIFSVPDSDIVFAVEYRLWSVLGQQYLQEIVLPTPSSGTYTISFDYDFPRGTYFGETYFHTPSGVISAGLSWQQILVEQLAWVVNPDGTFVPNPAFGTTTSVADLTLDCGAGFVGSICNLVAIVFFPSAEGIGTIQTAWAGVMSKAPFSFFTESHTVLSALQGGATSTSTFSLTIFGTTTPILAPQSAALIGLGSTELDFLKALVVVGLWILFAWFVYWRIASIFGV